MSEQSKRMDAVSPEDRALLADLRSMWEELDPCPADLAERAVFRLELENLDVEVMEIRQELTAAGARAAEIASTVIFETRNLSLTITVSSDGPRNRRIDGWLTPGCALVVRLHSIDGTRAETADDVGRFAFTDVPGGLVHFTVDPTDGAAVRLDRPIATPAVTI